MEENNNLEETRVERKSSAMGFVSNVFLIVFGFMFSVVVAVVSAMMIVNK